MIQIYNDAVNLGDALKQNCNKFKIGAFYFRILNLPPQLQSLLQNMHLMALYNENDIKETDESLNNFPKQFFFKCQLRSGIKTFENSGEKYFDFIKFSLQSNDMTSLLFAESGFDLIQKCFKMDQKGQKYIYRKGSKLAPKNQNCF